MRTRYKPRLTLWPIKRVKTRSNAAGLGTEKPGWKLYLFGLLPLVTLPRKAGR